MGECDMIRNRIYGMGLVGLVLLLLTACEQIPPAKVVTHAILCASENADQQVAVSGYAYLPNGMMTLVTDTMFMELFEQPNRGGEMVRVSMTLGTGNNQMVEPPDSYSDADMLIHADNGQEIHTGDYIQVEGKVIRTPSSNNSEKADCLLMSPIRVTIPQGG